MDKRPPGIYMNEGSWTDALNTKEYCSVCNESRFATSICTDCDIQMCDDCSRTHEKFFPKYSHAILLKSQNRDTSILAGKTLNTLCDVHEGKPVKFLCLACNCLICNECSLAKHQSHKKQALRKAVNETKSFIKHTEGNIIEQKGHREEKQQALKHLSQVNERKKAEIEEKIKLFIKDMVNFMCQKEKKLIQKLHEICDKNDALVKKSGEKCDLQAIMEKKLVQYIRNLDEHGSDTQLVKERTEIERRFQQLRLQQEKIEIPEDEISSVDFLSPNNVITKLQGIFFGDVVCNASSEKSSSDSDTIETFLENEPTEDLCGDVFASGSYKREVNIPPKNSCPPCLPPKPKPRPKPKPKPTEMRRSNLRDYESESSLHDYTECVPVPNGLFQAEVEVSGFDISQSGEIFIVSNHSKVCLVFNHDGTRRHKIEENLKDPWDVAAGRHHRNGVQVIYISDSGEGKSDGALREMSYTGHLYRDIGKKKMKSPKGVSISKHGDIYVCDVESHCIWVLSSNTGKIKRIEQKSGKPLSFQEPTYISVCPNSECYVTDRKSLEVIILGGSGEWKNTYTGSYRSGDADDNYREYDVQINPAMSCSDRWNNVYIIDKNSHCLHLLLSDGNVKEIAVKYEYYSPSPRSPPVCLAFDSNEELWIATESGAVFRFPSSDLQQTFAEIC